MASLLPVTSGLVLDLNATSLALTDGTAFSSWTDSSAAGNTATAVGAGSNPVYKTNLTPLHGPVVQWNNRVMTLASNTLWTSATSAELFAVIKWGGTSGGPDGEGFYQFGANDWTYYTYTDNNIYDGSFTNTRYSFAGVTPSSWHIYNVSHSGTVRTTRIDNVVVHTVTVGFTKPQNATKNTLMIGAVQAGGALTWNGYMSQICAWTRALTSAERVQTYNYLRSTHMASAELRWGQLV